MATTADLTEAIQKEIALLPRSFPYALSVATAADDADILALAEKHTTSVAGACAWQPVIDAREAGVVKLRTGRVTVVSREKGIVRGMITYVPSDGVCCLQAIASDESLPLNEQLRSVYAIGLPMARALLSLGYKELVTRAFPVDDRMAVFAGGLRDGLGMKRLEHRLDETGEITHWTLILDLAASLKLFEAMPWR